MTIEELAKQKVNSMPNSILVKYYEAGIPQWHMEAILTMLKQKKLSVLQEFILKFVSYGIDDVLNICEFLGINISAVNNAVAILQKNNLIMVDIFRSKLKLTDKGEEALKEAITIVPEDIEYVLYRDGLRGNIYLDTKKLYSSKQLHDFNIKPINAIIEKPSIDELEFEKVNYAIKIFKKNHAYERDKLEGNLLEVSHIVKTYVEYKKVFVLVFMNKKSKDIEFQVYDGTIRNDEYSIILQKQYNNNTRVLDFDKKQIIDEHTKYSLMSIVPQKIIDNAKSFVYKESTIERELSNLTTQIEVIKANAENDEEQSESEMEKIHFLEKRIDEMKNEYRGADRILFTYDHQKPLLINSLKNAQNIIVIALPYIKLNELNNEILGYIEKALQRGINIFIGYGIDTTKDKSNLSVQKLLKIQRKRYGENLHLIRLKHLYEKILIKDNEYIVITTFNWVPFKEELKKGFRQEIGYYTESKDVIKKIKENLSNKDWVL